MHPVSKAHCIKSYAGRIFSLLTFAFSLSVLSASAASFTGPVVSVLDGDTIEVLHNQHPERIRLSYKAIPQDSKARLAGRVRQGGSPICPRLARHAPGYMVLEGLEKEAREARKGLWWNRIPCRRGRWRHRKSREWQAYWLALARVASACVTRSGTRIVGLNMSGSESASRCPNDTHKNGATRSIVRKNGEAHILRASVCHVPSLIPTIRPARPQNTATKAPKTIIGSMITS